MESFKRAMNLDQGVIDLETGEFPVTLFTNGEASDGHILNIQGGDIPSEIPMFVNHNADPSARAGRLMAPALIGDGRALGDSAVKMVGKIDVTGDTAPADIRRDLAQGISVGDITAMSGRWDTIGSPTRRADLDKGHYAYRDSLGFYFDAWRALEGSIVGIGADSAALIGRAQDLTKPEHVREFYRALVEAPEAEVEVQVSGALSALAAQAREIPVLVPIETDIGEIYVSQEVADVWQASRDAADQEDEFTEAEASEERAESQGDPEAPVQVEPTIRLGSDNTIEIGQKVQVDPDVFDQIRQNFEGQMKVMRKRLTDGYKKILHDQIGRISDV